MVYPLLLKLMLKERDIPMKNCTKATWIGSIVKEFELICEKLHEKLEHSQPTNLLSDAEKMAIEQMQHMTRQIQQRAIQCQIDERTREYVYRTCSDCGQRMRHRGIKQRQFITRAGAIELSGIYLPGLRPRKGKYNRHRPLQPERDGVLTDQYHDIS